MLAKAVWITWENQRRNREISRNIGIKLYEMREIDDIRNPLIKYVTGVAKTLTVLRKEKPKIVFCQNPSLILSCLLILLKHFFHECLVVDAHNAGLFPKEGRLSCLMALGRFVQRHADLTIVTNRGLKRYVESNGGRAFVLPDPIPELKTEKKRDLKGKRNILFICSYAEDEPYEIVFDAARYLDRNVVIYVTGNYQKRGINPSDLPENVVLLGFIPEKDYVELLNSVDGTIDLTTRENCLVCGAYESVGVEKPMILSKTKALVEYFSMGAIYSEHKAVAMREAIGEVFKRRRELVSEVRSLKTIRKKEWESKKQKLQEILLGWEMQGFH
jgi:hypothetical protein